MSTVDVKISDDLVKPIIEAKIKEAFMAGIDRENRDKMLGEMVTHMINTKVNYKGEISSYSSDNKFKLVDILLKNALESKLSEALDSWISANEVEIKNVFLEELEKQLHPLTESLVNGLKKAITADWRTHFTIDLKKGY